MAVIILSFKNLPKLEGSPAQIEWATGIRSGFIRKAESFCSRFDYPESIEIVKKIFMNNTSCRWWIDNRYTAVEDLVLEEVSKDEPIIFDLPDLIGSQKQIAWATEIRSKYARCASYKLRTDAENIEKLAEKGKISKFLTKRYENLQEMSAKLFSIADCSVWIENRDRSLCILLEIMKNS